MEDSNPKTYPDNEGNGENAPSRGVAGASADSVGEAVVRAFEEELADANRRADENWDKYLRAEAELDNFRRAAERRRVEQVASERRRLLAELLAVADNLELALAHAETEGEPVRAGVEATYRALQRTLDREGVVGIDALEQAFDPSVHEAVSVVTVPGLDGERVVAVERPGYTVGGELLRAARVVVGRPPADGEG
jgi:molecular chaperone GrpE